ncbi:phosphoethanolamine transferase [Thauera propionica]|uniref:phosphoethanolamine transferase n=1 Tax=Thauera propionica TaxID=2019431 RepID=UPI0023EFE01A|nr:phosphoethanolamine transferase [Thauera propionica]MDD3673911.1 phosphoethanolamine transferase [Thauera propionica]
MRAIRDRQSPFRSSDLLAFAMVFTVVLCTLIPAHDLRRLTQIMVLALPPMCLLLWPIEAQRMRRLRALFVGLWAGVFMVDGAVRAYLTRTYQASADSALVLSAVANTGAGESIEYLSMYWPAMLPWAAVLLAGCLALAWVLRRTIVIPVRTEEPRAIEATRPRLRRWSVLLLCAVLFIGAIAYALKPWRRLHPLIFWPDWLASVQELRKEWADQDELRLRTFERAESLRPTLLSEGPSTVVVVISDSVNRDNLGLYGYARATTPRLERLRDELGESFLVLRHAWSVDAGTLASLRNLFWFGDPSAPEPMHVLALARAAGYHITWISNHDDIAIDQSHAAFADRIERLSRTRGRANRSADIDTLKPLQIALADPQPRKLIIVHLMGAHPHYSFRYPKGANPFDDGFDVVERELEQEGRPFWLQMLRDEYDAALLHHDTVLAESLELLRQAPGSDDYRAWLYLSDHGQEVGHDANHAGHSSHTVAGFRIPAIVWQNQVRSTLPVDVTRRPFRVDWTGWTLAHLLDIRWQGYDPGRDVLDGAYRWTNPQLPVNVASFEN